MAPEPPRVNCRITRIPSSLCSINARLGFHAIVTEELRGRAGVNVVGAYYNLDDGKVDSSK
jgi:hypothetical protein